MVYESVCTQCGKEHEYVAKMADREKTPRCCGKKTVQQISTPMIGAMSWTHAKGIHLGKQWISDGGTYKKYMKENGMVSESESKDRIADAHKRRKVEHEKSIERTVERIVAQANLK